MKAQRVKDRTGSHIEPPLKQSWTKLHKLQWHAEVLEADTGLNVSVSVSDYSTQFFGVWVHNPGYFDVAYRSGSIGPLAFQDAWSLINGIGIGHKLSRGSGD